MAEEEVEDEVLVTTDDEDNEDEEVSEVEGAMVEDEEVMLLVSSRLDVEVGWESDELADEVTAEVAVVVSLGAELDVGETEVDAVVVVDDDDASALEETALEEVEGTMSSALTSVSWVKRMARERSVRMRAGLAGNRMLRRAGERRGERRRRGPGERR